MPAGFSVSLDAFDEPQRIVERREPRAKVERSCLDDAADPDDVAWLGHFLPLARRQALLERVGDHGILGRAGELPGRQQGDEGDDDRLSRLDLGGLVAAENHCAL